MTLICYNKGCGIKFDEESNSEDSCVHHPGAPVFHDAYKGWSCCKKRTTDFTEFLNIPGCATSFHNPEKPPEPKPQPKEENSQEEIVVEPPRQRLPLAPQERPSETEPVTKLKMKTTPSLLKALEKMKLVEKAEEKENDPNAEITIGTSCRNNSCNKQYEGDHSKTEECIHHPGCPVFHEGYKFWTCCGKRTSDFQEFLNQVGCSKGEHKWFDSPEDLAKKDACRFDWHQTGSQVIITVYSKNSSPDLTVVEANQVLLRIDICFDNGRKKFQRNLILAGVIDPSRSSVELFGTKVEIKLKKSEPFAWKSLEFKTDVKES